MSRFVTVSLVTLLALAANAPATSRDRAHTPVAGKSPPTIAVHRSPTCGCCLKWVEHLRQAGYKVSVHESDDMQAIKQRLGVPDAQRSCHTAEVAGYFVEGHVPAADIARLLEDKPRARGIAVRGMPLGSPGMEVPDGTRQPYSVQLIDRDGAARTYSQHGK